MTLKCLGQVSCIEMWLSWLMHKLAKHLDSIDNVRPCNGEIYKTTNKISVLSRLNKNFTIFRCLF